MNKLFRNRQNSGITLIALVITVIVMLILVGVTINVALNGGLFQKAEQATKETEEKAILEEMLAMMDITDDGKINAQAIIDKMKEKYTVEGSIPNITITGKLGKYNYIVSETEIKKDSVPSQSGKLVYGKKYKGNLNINGTNVEMFLCFSEKYSIVVMDEEFTNLIYFSYDQQNISIASFRETEINLSEDGKVIYFNLYGMNIELNLTDEELFSKYSTEYLSEFSVYSGLYYNENSENPFIYVDSTNRRIMDITAGGYISTDPMSTEGIIDEKHIEMNGEIYTLIETLK